MAQDLPASDFEWVVCLGMHREAEADGVLCPLAASAVSVMECLACHHLVGVSEERASSDWCTTGEIDRQP